MNFWRQTNHIMNFFKQENFRGEKRLPANFMSGFLEVSPVSSALTTCSRADFSHLGPQLKWSPAVLFGLMYIKFANGKSLKKSNSQGGDAS